MTLHMMDCQTVKLSVIMREGKANMSSIYTETAFLLSDNLDNTLKIDHFVFFLNKDMSPKRKPDS